MATQAGHAFLHAFWDSMDRFPDMCQEYRKSKHAYKISCVVDTDLELKKLEKLSEHVGFTKVIDAGFTVFDTPTLTCVGIGPIKEDNPFYQTLKNLELLT